MTQRTVYFLGYSGTRVLLDAAHSHNATAKEWRAIDLLAEGQALARDVRALRRLAKLAGLPWSELFPDV